MPTLSPSRRALILSGWSVIALLGAAACRDDPAQDRQLPLSSCRLEGVQGRLLCGKVSVPTAGENADDVDLFVAVQPAVKRTASDPVVFLAGGPGQSASTVAHMVVPALRRVRKGRDLIFVDMRGTGRSGHIRCGLESDDLAERFRVEFPLDKLTACQKDLPVDPRSLTTAQFAEDLEQVRNALGAERINLVAASYGTRLALEYTRRYPTRVRTLVLDGVAPHEQRLFVDVLTDSQSALDKLVADCLAEAGCKKHFPNFERQLTELLAQLEDEPTRVELPHPRNAQPAKVELTRAAVVGVLRSLLYSTRLMQLVPWSIDQAQQGNWAPFVAQSFPLGDQIEETISIGTFLSVACAEDGPRIDAKETAELAKHSFIGLHPVESFQRACAIWPHATADAAFFEPVSGDTPALLLSGALDPITPPRWADKVASRFPNARHGISPGSAHGVMSVGCAPRLMADFIDAGDATALDLSCLEDVSRPPFFVDELGPARPEPAK